MNFLIREADISDGEVLARLRWDFRAEDGIEVPVVSWEEFKGVYADFFRKGLENKSRVHLVAVVDHKIVGTVVVQTVDMVPRPSKTIDQWGYVTDSYVVPTYRNQGVGSALLQEAIKWARSHDLELLITWPSEKAVSHYERHGFSGNNEILELILRDY